ncbi:hypothetical protein LCGC14_2831980 [marine sediment metagenome]|uniref:Peptidase C39-like domain-containing protein n=1 Tax=marine sediment metagenome TaxID=412755 RepID=A0A0F9B4R5_9ZZZZ
MSVENISVCFSLEDAQRACDAWGANCGPGAIAAIVGLTLDELRSHMGDFETKGYTNPTLMWSILNDLGVRWRLVKPARIWPIYGLARVQWEGPWTAPSVPMRARYRHTHWVGASCLPDVEARVFDINCICVGGWVSDSEWTAQVVPWLLRQCEPKASGRWHLTHVVEVERDMVRRRIDDFEAAAGMLAGVSADAR